MPVHQTVEPGVASPDRGGLRVVLAHHPDAQVRTTRTPERALDTLLELLERRRLSATELRILLAVLGSEMPVHELAESFGRPPVEIRRNGARLYARGLLNWRHDGASKGAVFAITPAGLATLRPLVTAAASGALAAHAVS